jgi:hypothetical protein
MLKSLLLKVPALEGPLVWIVLLAFVSQLLYQLFSELAILAKEIIGAVVAQDL